MPGIPTSHSPLRSLRDVEEFERLPVEAYVWSWNVNEWIRRGCEFDPDKVALHFQENPEPEGIAVSMTYRELRRRSVQAANLFHSLGVGPSDGVLFLMPTLPQLYIALLGALEAGVACCVNWMLKPAHLVELIRGARARVVIALGPTPGYEIWQNMEAIRSDLPDSVRILSVQALGGAGIAESDLDSLSSKQPGDRLVFQRAVGPDDIAAYVHSGGTTGSPKLVQLTQRGFCYKCWANTVVMAHVPEDVIFADYPMFHIAGFFGRGILPIACGNTIAVPSPLGARDRKFVANYWKFVERYRITILSGVPTTLSVLAKNPPRGEDISSLRKYMCTGSTAMPVEAAKEIERATGVRVLLTYGATEFTQNVTQIPRDGELKHGSGGIRLPFTQVKAVKLAPDGSIERDCAVDEIGAVVVRGPSITPGYVDPKYNRGLFTREGWLNNGDLGRIDADGYLWITGRAKDLIIRGGHNLDPSLIEDALLQRGDVLVAAAVGKPDAYAGELPVAYVQLARGSDTTAAELEAYARENVSEPAAAPKEIHILEQMPLTDVGKPNKAKLRRDAAGRAYREAIAAATGLDGGIAVEVVPDATHGTVARIAIAPEAARAMPGLEREIERVMKAYATHYLVRRL